MTAEDAKKSRRTKIAIAIFGAVFTLMIIPLTVYWISVAALGRMFDTKKLEGGQDKPPIELRHYRLDEYYLDKGTIKTLLGGTWTSLRLLRRDGEQTTQSEIVDRISSALLADEWEAMPRPDQPPSYGELYEMSDDDLVFKRSMQEQIVYISEDASVICIYYLHIK